MKTVSPKLEWTLTPKADVATDGFHTFFILKKVPAGRPNRCHLFVVAPGNDPIVMGRELTPGHCRRISQRLSDRDEREVNLLSLLQQKAGLASRLLTEHFKKTSTQGKRR